MSSYIQPIDIIIANNGPVWATVPTRATPGSAGYDLHAYLPNGTFISKSGGSGRVILPGDRALIPTGCRVALPIEMYGRIAPRSGLAWKNGLDIMAGVIDSDYRGDIGVIIINHGTEPFEINHGDRIAQIIFEHIYTVGFHLASDMDPTSRGAGGYGSTGTA